MNVVVAIILAQVAEALEADPTLAAKLRTLLAPAAPVDPFVKSSASGIAPGTVKRLVRQGRLTVHRIGRENFLKRSEVAAYIESRGVLKEAPESVEGDEAERQLSRAAGSTKTGFRTRGSR